MRWLGVFDVLDYSVRGMQAYAYDTPHNKKAQDAAAQGRAVAQTNFSPKSPHPYVMYSTRLCVGVCDVCVGAGVSVCVTD